MLVREVLERLGEARRWESGIEEGLVVAAAEEAIGSVDDTRCYILSEVHTQDIDYESYQSY